MTNTRQVFLALSLVAASALPLSVATFHHANAAATANPQPSPAERATANAGNKIDQAFGADRPSQSSQGQDRQEFPFGDGR